MDAELQRRIEGCAASHAALDEHVARLDDASMRRASLLPGWTVGHVLTHVARNADSYGYMLEGAMVGEQREQYPGGMERRDGDIESGAGRPAADIAADVHESSNRLDAVFAAMTDGAWDFEVSTVIGPLPSTALPGNRWREVEIHRVDLGLDYVAEQWPDGFVESELPKAVAGLPDRVADPGERSALLAWLVDRGAQPDLQLDGWLARVMPTR